MKKSLKVWQFAGFIFTVIAGDAATKCFGVRGMADKNVKDGIVSLLRRENMSKGVSVSFVDDKINIEVHIIKCGTIIQIGNCKFHISCVSIRIPTCLYI